MNKQLVAATALALSAIASPAVAETTDWSGPYVGVYAGMNANETDVAGSYATGAGAGVGVAPNISGNSLAAGGTLGYSVQVEDSFVIGLEGDFGTGAKAYNRIDTTFSGITLSSTWNSKLNWLASVRARAGLASGKTLFYVTGGLALADADLSFGNAISNIDEQYTLTGYATGVGVEHRLGSQLSVKAEYVRLSFPNRVVAAPDIGGGLTPVVPGPKTGFKPTVNSLRLGVNYTF